MTKVRLDVMSGVSALLGPGSWELVLVMMILENIHSIIYRAERVVGRICDAVEFGHLNCHNVFFTRSYYELQYVLVEKDHRSKWKPLQGLNQC